VAAGEAAGFSGAKPVDERERGALLKR